MSTRVQNAITHKHVYQLEELHVELSTAVGANRLLVVSSLDYLVSQACCTMMSAIFIEYIWKVSFFVYYKQLVYS
jgi:hypothetical protein